MNADSGGETVTRFPAACFLQNRLSGDLILSWNLWFVTFTHSAGQKSALILRSLGRPWRMLSFRRTAMLMVAAATMIKAQPALTTIQDILYRADGTRFNGEIFISWNAFEAGDTSNI